MIHIVAPGPDAKPDGVAVLELVTEVYVVDSVGAFEVLQGKVVQAVRGGAYVVIDLLHKGRRSTFGVVADPDAVRAVNGYPVRLGGVDEAGAGASVIPGRDGDSRSVVFDGVAGAVTPCEGWSRASAGGVVDHAAGVVRAAVARSAKCEATVATRARARLSRQLPRRLPEGSGYDLPANKVQEWCRRVTKEEE